jgi:hypothetical protein
MSQNASSGFAAFVPGFEFLQNLAKQGQQLGSAAGGLPQLNHWVAPTLDVEELEKRIQELKAVHFWLDQNSKALAATIQALEVQKMTLATLKSMNVNLGEMADAFKVDPAGFASAPQSKTPFAGFEVPPRHFGAAAAEPQPAPAPAPAPAQPEPEQPKADADPKAQVGAGAAIDPVQWWGALSEQFQAIASHALQEVVVPAMAAVATPKPAKASRSTSTAAKAKAPAAASKKPAAKKAVPAKSATRSAVRKPAGTTRRKP